VIFLGIYPTAVECVFEVQLQITGRFFDSVRISFDARPTERPAQRPLTRAATNLVLVLWAHRLFYPFRRLSEYIHTAAAAAAATNGPTKGNTPTMPGLHLVTQQNKKRRNSCKAVRILTEPFPVPPVCHATVDMPETGKIGVRFRWNGKPGDRVQIVAIEDDSPIIVAATGGSSSSSSSSSSSMIQTGHTVLAVNGVPALKSSQVGQLIRSSGRQVTLTTCLSGPMENAPYCKVLTAPGGKLHPGINIDSTRDRCLVRITRIFPNGPFAGGDLREGDLLLAVNGVAVSKPEDAERRLQDASIHSPFVHLYVLDMQSYRQSIVDEIQASSRLYEGLTLTENLDGSSRHHYLLRHNNVSTSNAAAFPVQFNPETQRIVNNPALVPPLTARGFQGKRSYLDLIRPFVKAYNDGMEERMRVLEEAVSCEVWRISCDAAKQQELSCGAVGAAAAGICTSSDDEISLAWSGGSESLTPPPSCVSPSVVELDTVQVAAAELIVLPLEALQTLDERINHQTLLMSI
jgi:hypothetical protein